MTSPDQDNTKPDNNEPNDGVVDGPKESATPEIDPNKVGPDGTVYDEDATDEAKRKMGIDD